MKSENQVPKSWQEIGPLLYREKDGQDRVGFTKDGQGHMILSQDFPFEVSMRVGLLDSKGFNTVLLIFVLTVVLLTLLFWPVSFFLRRHYVHPLGMHTRAKRWRLAIRLVVLLEFAYMACWLALLSGGQPLFDASLDPTFAPSSLSAGLRLWAHWSSCSQWARTWPLTPGEWLFSRFGNALIALSAVSFSWVFARLASAPLHAFCTDRFS